MGEKYCDFKINEDMYISGIRKLASSLDLDR